MLLLSNVSNPIRPLGSAVTLNCTMMLNSGPEIDIPLTVEVELSKSAPVRSSLTTTTLSLSGSTYSTTTATVTSFGREQSGFYTCRATVTVRQPNSDYITNNGPLSDNITLSTGASNCVLQMWPAIWNGTTIWDFFCQCWVLVWMDTSFLHTVVNVF